MSHNASIIAAVRTRNDGFEKDDDSVTLRPPRLPPLSKTPQQSLDYEIAQEQAATLGRLGRRLEAALAALAAFDADPTGEDRERRRRRSALVDAASVALWHLIVQREVLGLGDSARVLRDYGVPNDVRDRTGIVSPITSHRLWK